MKVLVVEDHDDARDMLVTLLGLHGLEVRGVATGSQALDAIRDWTPDAAVVDFVLPDMDGRELARRVREEPGRRDMFLVALTGHSGEQVAAEAGGAGFDQFFVKPVDPDTIIEVLKQRDPGG